MAKRKRIGQMRRNKGKVGERELRDELSRLFKVPCRRTQQYSGTEGTDDVTGLPGVHVECKRREKFNLYDAIEQAVNDSDGDVPLVCHRRNRKDWVAIVRLNDLPELVVRLYLLLAR